MERTPHSCKGAPEIEGPPEIVQCLDCGYALRGLSRNECPECGRAFDPADPKTYRQPAEPKVEVWECALLAFTPIVSFVAFDFAAAEREPSRMGAVLGQLFPIAVLGICLAYAMHATHERVRWFRVTAIIVGLIVLLECMLLAQMYTDWLKH